MSVCPDTDSQQCSASSDPVNMLGHTFCSPAQPRCCAVNKPDTSPQGKDKDLCPPTHPKEPHKSRHPHFHSDLSCPVCLQTATCPVETNCGHLFCGSCLIEYWKHDPWLGAISCPLCRQKVHILYNDLCEIQQDKMSREIIQDIRQYNNRFSGKPRPIADYLYDLPSLLHLALRRIFTMGGLVWIFCLRIIVCSFGAIMCLSPPFDVISDPMCGILSTIDDLVVVFLLLNCMINICQQFQSEGMTMTQATAQSILTES